MNNQIVKYLNIEDIWTKVLENIKERISKPSFDTWFAPVAAHIEDEDLLIIIAKNEFAKDWLEMRYKDLIFEAIRKVAGRTFEIEIVSTKNMEKSSSPDIFKLDKRQALGYFLLACKDTEIPEETIKEIYKNLCWQLDMKTPEEAEREGYEWYKSLNREIGTT